MRYTGGRLLFFSQQRFLCGAVISRMHLASLQCHLSGTPVDPLVQRQFVPPLLGSIGPSSSYLLLSLIAQLFQLGEFLGEVRCRDIWELFCPRKPSKSVCVEASSWLLLESFGGGLAGAVTPGDGKRPVIAVEPHLMAPAKVEVAGRDSGTAPSPGTTRATETGFIQSLSFCLSAVFTSMISSAGRCRQHMIRTTPLMVTFTIFELSQVV